MDDTDPYSYLTLAETAAKLRISKRTLSRLIIAGKGPVTSAIGRRRLIRTIDLQVWQEAVAMPTRSDAA